MNMYLSLDALGAYSWLVIPFGLFLGLLGYRMYKIALFIVGLFFGMGMSTWFAEFLGNPRLGLMLGIVIGVGIGIAAHFLFRFGLFIAGMIGGFAVANLILPETDVVVSTLDTLVWFGSAGLAGGLLTLILYKFFILLIISLIATCMIYMGTVTLLPPETASWSWVLYVVLLAVFFLVQVCAQKGHPDPMGRANRYREW